MVFGPFRDSGGQLPCTAHGCSVRDLGRDAIWPHLSKAAKHAYETATARLGASLPANAAAERVAAERAAAIKDDPAGLLRALAVRCLDEGQVVRCPGCNVGTRKDEACLHMRCPRCKTRFCYACATHLADNSTCRSGCDNDQLYLHLCKGWKHHGDGDACVLAFHRQRILFNLSQLRVAFNADTREIGLPRPAAKALWQQAVTDHSSLLEDVLPGHSVKLSHSAKPPLVGRRRDRSEGAAAAEREHIKGILRTLPAYKRLMELLRRQVPGTSAEAAGAAAQSDLVEAAAAAGASGGLATTPPRPPPSAAASSAFVDQLAKEKAFSASHSLRLGTWVTLRPGELQPRHLTGGRLGVVTGLRAGLPGQSSSVLVACEHSTRVVEVPRPLLQVAHRRLRAGDRVVLSGCCAEPDWGNLGDGRIGVVQGDDEDDRPFRVATGSDAGGSGSGGTLHTFLTTQVMPLPISPLRQRLPADRTRAGDLVRITGDPHLLRSIHGPGMTGLSRRLGQVLSRQATPLYPGGPNQVRLVVALDVEGRSVAFLHPSVLSKVKNVLVEKAPLPECSGLYTPQRPDRPRGVHPPVFRQRDGPGTISFNWSIVAWQLCVAGERIATSHVATIAPPTSGWRVPIQGDRAPVRVLPTLSYKVVRGPVCMLPPPPPAPRLAGAVRRRAWEPVAEGGGAAGGGATEGTPAGAATLAGGDDAAGPAGGVLVQEAAAAAAPPAAQRARREEEPISLTDEEGGDIDEEEDDDVDEEEEEDVAAREDIDVDELEDEEDEEGLLMQALDGEEWAI